MADTKLTQSEQNIEKLRAAQKQSGVTLSYTSYELKDSRVTTYIDNKENKLIKDETVGVNGLLKHDVVADELQSAMFKSNLKLLSQMDRRASLTVAPKMGLETPTLFSNKVLYALGTTKVQNPDGGNRTFYNFLQSMLSNTGGIIFPYTPSIDTNYHVNYETTEIPQSNSQYNAYKNSPPPSISVSAKFTANTKEDTAYMLSVIWFLQALTKCDIGNGSVYYKKDSIGGGGLPPPVLYFNAYHQLMENIPVVISSFNIKYPDDIDYVNIIIDMEDLNESFFDSVYDAISSKTTPTGEKTYQGNDKWTVGNYESILLNDTFKMSFWLPLEISITMSFLIQTNLARENNCFNLDAYKAGILRNRRMASVITSAGTIENKSMFTEVKSTSDAWKAGKKKYLPTGWTW